MRRTQGGFRRICVNDLSVSEEKWNPTVLGFARGAVGADQVLLENLRVPDGVKVRVSLGFLGCETFL